METMKFLIADGQAGNAKEEIAGTYLCMNMTEKNFEKAIGLTGLVSVKKSFVPE